MNYLVNLKVKEVEIFDESPRTDGHERGFTFLAPKEVKQRGFFTTRDIFDSLEKECINDLKF